MSEHDYEALFNEILVKTRERRKSLKESLDRYFDEDPVRVSDVLAEMIRVNDRAQTIENNRAAFMSLMSAMRAVLATREEVLTRIDKLMDEMRQFLAIKEEMASDRLEKLTQLFRDELGNPSFKFHFHLLDDQELHHLSEIRSFGRKVEEYGQEEVEAEVPEPEPTIPAQEHRAILEEPPQKLDVEKYAVPISAGTERYFVSTPPPVEEVEPVEPEPVKADWAAEPVNLKNEPRPTLHGVPPDDVYAVDLETAAPGLALEPEPEPEPKADEAASPYEVDVDVLKILSEETFKVPRKGR